jgi:hypothetical protein
MISLDTAHVACDMKPTKNVDREDFFSGPRYAKQRIPTRNLGCAGRTFQRGSQTGKAKSLAIENVARHLHLKGLRQLRNLTLGCLPITDAGLNAIKDMPALDVLYLSRTNIKGPGLAD